MATCTLRTSTCACESKNSGARCGWASLPLRVSGNASSTTTRLGTMAFGEDAPANSRADAAVGAGVPAFATTYATAPALGRALVPRGGDRPGQPWRRAQPDSTSPSSTRLPTDLHLAVRSGRRTRAARPSAAGMVTGAVHDDPPVRRARRRSAPASARDGSLSKGDPGARDAQLPDLARANRRQVLRQQVEAGVGDRSAGWKSRPRPRHPPERGEHPSFLRRSVGIDQVSERKPGAHAADSGPRASPRPSRSCRGGEPRVERQPHSKVRPACG